MIPKNKIKRYKAEIRKACKLCEGAGCSECSSRASRGDIYADAQIPITYWSLAWKGYTGDARFKELISSKLKDIAQVYDNGESFLFAGKYGTGKTYATCCILKVALVNGFSARYIPMQEIVNRIMSKELDTLKVLDNLTSVDFLAIDEFDPRWIFPSENVEQLFGQTMEYILRTRWQNGLPTILSTNIEDADQVLKGKFADSFKSLRSQYLNVVPVVGQDYRRKNEKR